jgi:hypothetical protein
MHAGCISLLRYARLSAATPCAQQWNPPRNLALILEKKGPPCNGLLYTVIQHLADDNLRFLKTLLKTLKMMSFDALTSRAMARQQMTANQSKIGEEQQLSKYL